MPSSSLPRNKIPFESDPKNKNRGWKLLESGVLKEKRCSSSASKLERKEDWIRRMDGMVNQVQLLLDKLEQGGGGWDGVVVIEQPEIFITGRKGRAANNAGTVLKLTAVVYTLRQAIREYSSDYDIDVVLVPVRKWKGHTPKERTMFRMKRRWNWTGEDDNESDALGIGTWFIDHKDEIYNSGE